MADELIDFELERGRHGTRLGREGLLRARPMGIRFRSRYSESVP